MRDQSRGLSRATSGDGGLRSIAGPVLKFAATGFAGLLLVAATLFVFLQEAGVSEAIRNARQITRVAGRGIVEPELTPAVIAGRESALRRLDAIVRNRVLKGRLERIKVWDESGRIVYSDEPRLIGSSYSLDEEDREAMTAGGVQAELSDLAGPENRFERGHGQLLEVYMPVRSIDGEPLLFEAYLRFSSVTTGGQRILFQFAPAFVVALALLWLLQVPLAWSMARKLRDRLREREALLQRAIDASDAERRRIAGDLHDGIVQDLAGLSFTLTGAADQIRKGDGQQASTRLGQAAATSRAAVRQLRTLLVEIYPPKLHSAGLEAALLDLVEPVRARDIEVSVEVPAGLELSPPAEALLFRTAQEALRNVMSHADATRVEVIVHMNGTIATLEVVDDGKGFSSTDAERRRSEGHLGLELLSGLVSDAGGRLDVRSEPDRGVSLRVEVPAA